jgi:acetyltransferase-like isoleucine patch superfamily enzyme
MIANIEDVRGEGDLEVHKSNTISKRKSKTKEFYHAILLEFAKRSISHKIRIKIYKHLGMRIGENVYIGPGLEIIDQTLSRLVTLGDRVTISPRVTFVVSSSPNKSKLRGTYPRKIGKIYIEDDAWIATGAIILPSITIGKMSVVGAGAVVTKAVTPFTVVGGVPAKVIKKIGENNYEKM